jgi:lipopolysaccharide export system permease protein
MNRIFRYIFQQLAIGLILVTAVLICLIWLITSLRFVEMVVNRGLTAWDLIYLTILAVPKTFPFILPIALFLAVAFVYSKMISDRELVVLRSSGLSQMALARPGLLLALAATLVIYVLNIFVLPESHRRFKEVQWEYRYGSAAMLREGTFNNFGEDYTIFVRQRTSSGQYLGVLVHDNRDPDQPTSYMAERGALVESDNGPRVVLFDGNRQVMDRKTGRLTMLYFDRTPLDLNNIIKIPESRNREARERSLNELFNARNDPTVMIKDYDRHIVEAHMRLTTPLMALSLTAVGLACLLTGAFTRRSQNKRVFLAVTLMFFVEVLAFAVQYLSNRNTDLVPLMYVSVLLPGFIGLLVMMKATEWRIRRRSPAAA